MPEKIVDLAEQIPDEAQPYEKEKIEYGNQKIRETSIKERNEMALRMLNRNMDIIDIMEVTGLTENELLRLQNEK